MNNNLLKIIGCSLISAIIFGSFYIFKYKEKSKKINISNYFYKNISKSSKEIALLYFDDFNLDYQAFHVACAVEQNVNILLQIIEQCNININKTNIKGNDGFMIACCNNRNLQVVQFLAAFPNQDIHKKNLYRRNAFLLACQFNDNLQIIKFLAELYDLLDVNKNAIYKMNAIYLACENNNNLNVMKYLVEITNIYQINIYRPILYACQKHKTNEIILYLIEDFKIYIMELNFFKKKCSYIVNESNRIFLIKNIKKSNYTVYTNMTEYIRKNQIKIYNKIKLLNN